MRGDMQLLVGWERGWVYLKAVLCVPPTPDERVQYLRPAANDLAVVALFVGR